MKTIPRLAVITTLCLVSGAHLHAGQDPRSVIPSVSVSPVVTLEASQPKTYVGTVDGAESVAIVARISGTLTRANFREGGMVQAGDVLYEIEDTVYKATVDIAEALIEQSVADYELAIKEHERSVELLKSRAIAAQAFDMTQSTENLKKAKVAEARANLVLARHDLEHCRIVSPITGRIGEKLYSEGNYITPALGVMATVVQYQPIKVRFSMSESDFFRYFSNHDELKNVDLAVIRANGKQYEGSVRPDFVDNQVDSRTDTIMVHLECDNPGDQLLPGGFVQVQLSERFDAPLPAVPAQALMTDGARHYVYVVAADNTVSRRDVTLGDVVFSRQTVLDGIEPGETVVVGGLNKVTPGGTVTPVPAQF